jgi:hypothetical protein
MRKDMPMPECQQESVIAAALATGELTEHFRLHMAGCAVCGEIHSIARKMLQLADGWSEEPHASAASMWWRLNLRMRRERARRAQLPLVWMFRIFYAAVALTAALLVASVPGLSRPVVAIGLFSLSAVVLPVAITLWVWSRSTI